MAWLAAVLLIVFTRQLLQIRSLVLRTSLRQAWFWMLVCVPTLALVIVAQIFHASLPPGWLNAAEWLAGVFLMTPPIAVLGARRPGTRAWPWFVVLPLVIVLLWPAGSELLSSHGKEPLSASTPALLGFLIAGLMGFGNYFGTQNTFAAILYFVAPTMLLLHVAGWADTFVSTSVISLLGLCGSFSLSLQRFQVLNAIERGSAEQTANRLWYLFRDFLGIVWAKRVMDRMNLFAQRERWTVELTLDGFVARPGMHAATTDDFRRPIETLAWLLRRFADEDWVDEQLRPFSFHSQKESIDV